MITRKDYTISLQIAEQPLFETSFLQEIAEGKGLETVRDERSKRIAAIAIELRKRKKI